MMKKTKMKRVPKLRFPEFTDDWEQRKLSEVTSMHARIGWQNLRTSEFLDSGDYMLITGTDFNDGAINFSTCHYVERDRYEQDRNIQIHNGSILITKDGTLGKVAYVQGLSMPATLNAGVFNVQIKDANIVDEKYLFQYLKAPFLMDYVGKKATGGTIKHLNQSILVDFPVILPQKSEQIRIGAFFQQLDHLITLHQRKLEKLKELKKGLVQKLFSQEVRFKADDGSEFPKWEEKRLSGLFGKVIEKNRLDLPALTIIQGYGTIRRDESERKITYDEKGLKNYKAVQKDDFIVHLRSFEGGLEIANQDGIVSPAYHVYRGNDEVHPLFYYPYFRSSSFIKGKLAVCVTGVRDGKNIEMGAFDELLIPHPCLAEQQKIAECLSALDDVIEKQKATLAAWEELKKGLLQQMFV